MQIGEFIPQRILPDYVRLACEQQGITCTSYSDDWLLYLQKGSKTAWFCGYKTDLNRSAASQIAQDKAATYEVLSVAGLPAVQHVLVRPVQTAPIDEPALVAALPGEVVLKPLQGTSGRGVRRFASVALAVEHMRGSDEPAWAASPYLEVTSETRILVLNQTVLMAYEKQNPQVVHGLAMYNLSHGARAVDIVANELPNELRELALQTCKALDLQLAAVDVVTLQDGSRLVLEVNDGFSMEHYALQGADFAQRAAELYDAVVAAMVA